MNQRRRRILGATLAIATAPLGNAGAVRAQSGGDERELRTEGDFPSLAGATAWLNSQPLAPSALRGKVVVVNFCTYSCINWLRSLPYVRAWAGKYRDQGLVVIGVHTPEFGFEKELPNIRRALKEMGVSYPVAVDSDYAVWRAFNNDYWPALYFIDAHGRIRHHKFGEGDYDRSEGLIQNLLLDAGATGFDRQPVAIDSDGVEKQADWDHLKSPETYVGYGHGTDSFASAGGALEDLPKFYKAPPKLELNEWALTGNWTMGTQATVLNTANGRIACCFHARDVNLVLGPSATGKPVQFRVRLDGQPPGVGKGVDVDDDGIGMVTVPRLYQLIRQRRPITDRQFSIDFVSPGVESFVFTFG
jgi:thiol-disulfide isomerase/thioredoxin